MKNTVIYFAIVTVITCIGNAFNLPCLDETIHTTSHAAILAMWVPIFAVIALIPYLPYYAQQHMSRTATPATSEAAEQQEQPTTPAPAAALYVGQEFSSPAANCVVRVKALKSVTIELQPLQLAA